MENGYGNNMQYEGYTDSPYDNQLQAMKKKIILALIGIVALLAVIFLSGQSTINIRADGAADGTAVTYTITDKDGKTSTGTMSGKSASKTVKKGAYQVAIRQDETSYDTFVDTKGFLRKTEVSANLQGEAARRFVGATPSTCMYYVHDTLLSSACGNPYETLQIHRPAGGNLPPLVETINGRDFYGPLEGIANTKFGTIAVTQVSVSEDEPRGHYAAVITDRFDTTDRTRLAGLDADKIYTVQPYKDGFIAYATASSEFKYFTSLTANPTTIPVTAPADKQFQPYFASASANGIVAISSDTPTDGVVEGDPSGAVQADTSTSEIAVVTNGTQKNFAAQGRINDALACGTNRLCTLTNDSVHIYDTSGKKLKQLTVIPDAQAIKSTAKGLLVITKKEALLLDINKQEGFAEYTFGEYTYCGASVTTTGYVLCVQKGQSIHSALLFNQDSKSNDRIDKKVLELTKSSSVSFVTAFGNFIYVVPNYGEIEYDAAQNLNLYSPQRQAAANKAIATLGTKLGLNKAPYQLVNTGL